MLMRKNLDAIKSLLDIISTMLLKTTMMSMLYSGQMKSMMPKLHSTNFPGMELIRPMYLIKEEDIIRLAAIIISLRLFNAPGRFTENLNKTR